ncbi:hypothetical protein LUX05_03775 [Streptomyces somaliensis]|nr:hypothetical protein [Streptomyces somaliensis]
MDGPRASYRQSPDSYTLSDGPEPSFSGPTRHPTGPFTGAPARPSAFASRAASAAVALPCAR